ncbi:Uncharacterised protein [Neisseria gonorrhoeae]|nr:hypothetical protein M716_10295 [Neisseria gonorrhoeae SK32402]KLS85998.1 hypothetical protein M774_03250 [Neisseria gonorrhoeae MU_NG5]KLT01988.1 hypothetical protein M790_05315 [Neisseria gonorrhoeae MU_NG25]CFH39598.1 Uncharacterised protein [Neisseria gonorrhoeae]CNQ40843.1 Uncharacterised protein [Neisseria gonorrhoeae]
MKVILADNAKVNAVAVLPEKSQYSGFSNEMVRFPLPSVMYVS